MYFSHERTSPIQSPRHRIDYDKTKNDWVQTNFETDQFEEEQFEHSRNIFQTNVENERRKEEEYFQNLRNTLASENEDIWDDNNLNNNKILTTFIPPPVEPAQAPIKLNVINMVSMNDGH